VPPDVNSPRLKSKALLWDAANMVDIPNMRRVYSRPWQRGSTANPGKVSTGIAVGVRPETTLFAHETMPDALADTSTIGARLAGKGRIDVFDGDSNRPGFVFDICGIFHTTWCASRKRHSSRDSSRRFPGGGSVNYPALKGGACESKLG
jgi:hypothetical protein